METFLFNNNIIIRQHYHHLFTIKEKNSCRSKRKDISFFRMALPDVTLRGFSVVINDDAIPRFGFSKRRGRGNRAPPLGNVPMFDTYIVTLTAVFRSNTFRASHAVFFTAEISGFCHDYTSLCIAHIILLDLDEKE